MKQLLFLFMVLLSSNLIFAETNLTNEDNPKQDSTIVKSKLIPIVQVFGQAKYQFREHNYGFDFGRAHVGLLYTINDNWSSKIIIDRGRPTTAGTIIGHDTEGNIIDFENTSQEGAFYTMYLKFASLKWNVSKDFSIEGGAVLQNHYITQERFWGLRYIAQTFQDMYWHIPSSDLGFLARYKINSIIGLDASITNGEGPRVKQDQFGKVKFSTGMDITPSEKIQLRVYYHQKGTGVDSLMTERMYSLFTGFQPHKKLRIGAEFNYMQHFNNLSELNSYGYSIFSTFQIRPQTALFVRVDKLKNNPENYEIKSSGSGIFILSGFSFKPVSGINLSLNYRTWLPDNDENRADNILSFSMEYKL